MKFLGLLKTIKKQEKRIEELEQIIIDNHKSTTMLIAEQVKMLEWISKTDKEIDKLRKETVKE